MRKEWELIPKILSGEKYVESRWYKTRKFPWNVITAGDEIYFRNTGSTYADAKATVARVEQHKDLAPGDITSLTRQHHVALGIPEKQVEEFLHHVIQQRYCILIWLTAVQATHVHITLEGRSLRNAWHGSIVIPA